MRFYEPKESQTKLQLWSDPVECAWSRNAGFKVLRIPN